MFCIPIETSLSLEGALHQGFINQTLKSVSWINLLQRPEIGPDEDCRRAEFLNRCLYWRVFFVRVPPGVVQAWCAARSDWLTPSTHAKLFFKRFVNSSQKHILWRFIASILLQNYLCWSKKKKRKKENWSPDSHPHGIHGRSRQALDISADGSLNRTKSSDASLQFVFTWHKRLLSLVFSLSTVQQAQARFMNAGIKNKKKAISRLWKLLPVRVILSKQTKYLQLSAKQHI